MRSFGTKILLSLFAIIGWVLVVGVMGAILGERSVIGAFLGFFSIVVLGYVIVRIFKGATVPVSGDGEVSAKPRRYGRWMVAGFVIWVVYLVVTFDPAELEARREKDRAALIAARTEERNKIINYEVMGTEESHHFVAMNAVPIDKDDSDDVLARRYFRTADYVCRNDRSDHSKETKICIVSIWNSKHQAPASLSGLKTAAERPVAYYEKNFNSKFEEFTFRDKPYSILDEWRNY